MAAAKIQANYDQLAQIAARFSQEANQTQQLFQAVRALVEQLEGGAWIGVGAQAFFQEMHELMYPALNRLGSSLGDAGSATKRISEALRGAEDEAGALFRGEGDSGAGAGARAGEAGEAGSAGSPSGGSSGGGASGSAGTYTPTVNLSDNEYFRPGGDTPDSHWERNDAYDEIVEAVGQLPGEGGKVRFFQAAERVTRSTMLGGTSFTPDFVMSEEAFAFTNKVGEDLYTFNKGQAEKVIADPFNLYDPNGTGRKMGSAMEFDLNYVHAEQSRVESWIRSESAAGRLNSGHIVELSDAINGDSPSSMARDLFYKGTSPVADTAATEWATSFAGGRLDFNNQNHREAIGKAMVFQAHGYSQADYLNYMRTGKMP